MTQFRVFPATLIRLTDGRNPILFAEGDKSAGEYRSPDDLVQVSGDGFVQRNLGPQASSTSNGAVFRPNTHTMQEIIRMVVDQHIENEDTASPDDIPIIFTVAKGVKVPDVLTLVREDSCKFSLQPREPLTLSALNEVLLEFHRTHAKEQIADEWLDGHEYENAFAADKEEEWMAV